jgi:hypothetical protein
MWAVATCPIGPSSSPPPFRSAPTSASTFALRHLLESAGFHVSDLRPLGGYDRSLAQMLALWLRRRPMNPLLRAGLTLLIYPLWTFLRISQEPEAHSFEEGMMLTGLVATARKMPLHSDRC